MVAFQAGKPGVSYCGGPDAMLGHFDGAAWSLTTVATASTAQSGMVDRPGATAGPVDKSGDVVGTWPRCAITSAGVSYLAWQDIHFGGMGDNDLSKADLEFAYDKGAGFVVGDEVDNLGAGEYNAMALNQAGQPVVAYSGYTAGGVEVAVYGVIGSSGSLLQSIKPNPPELRTHPATPRMGPTFGGGRSMPANADDYDAPLARAAEHARSWLGSVGARAVPPRVTADALRETFGGPLPRHGCDAAEVVDQLAAGAEPGLMAMGSGRFFGWVIGGTLPAALAADWLVSAWDQNAGMRYATPAVAAIEEAAAAWLLDLLGLPAGADVGFVTGATMANFSCLAAARYAVLAAAGWDVARRRAHRAVRAVHVLVGAERHDTIDLALRYLGLGAPTRRGRRRPGPDPARRAGRRAGCSPEPASRSSSACRPATCTPARSTRSPRRSSWPIERGAWVHVDGAFGLWAAACPELAAPRRRVWRPPTPGRPTRTRR